MGNRGPNKHSHATVLGIVKIHGVVHVGEHKGWEAGILDSASSSELLSKIRVRQTSSPPPPPPSILQPSIGMFPQTDRKKIPRRSCPLPSTLRTPDVPLTTHGVRYHGKEENPDNACRVK